MDPYAKSNERRVGSKRPKIQHRPPDPAQPRTRADREAEKQSVIAERRRIKKAARRNLQAEMLSEVAEPE